MRKILLLAGVLLLSGQVTQAQRVVSYQLLPANATASDDLRLVLTLFYGGCTRSFSYNTTRTGSSLAIRGCYPAVTVAMPCGGTDTIRLGRLPAGSYTVSTACFVAMTAANCASSTFISPGQPSATGSFTVGAALATREAANNAWQLVPTILPAGNSTLYLTDVSGVSSLQQLIICDVIGREKARFDAQALITRNGRTEVPLPSLPPALYVLRALDRSGRVSSQRFAQQ